MTTAAKIREIADPWDRALAAQDALRKVEPVAKTIRARRDVAALVLIEPFVRAAQESNEFRATAKAQYKGYWAKADGEMVATTKNSAKAYGLTHPGVDVIYHKPSIRYAEYVERLETARKMRDDAFAAARARGEKIMEPVEVYETLGMHRNLLVRLQQRRSAVPEMPDALEVGIKARDELKPLTEAINELREIRDTAIDVLLAEAIPSVDIANHLGLSPARVTQIRQGARRSARR